MMFYISMECHENILNSFQVMERTRNYRCPMSKGNISKPIKIRVTVLMFCMLSDDALYIYKVS